MDQSWSFSSPESRSRTAAVFSALDKELETLATDAWMIVRGGRILHEWYREDGANPRFGAASMSKALVGSLGLMLAVDRGLLRLDAPASDYVTAWRAEPLRRATTIRQLADHSSGLPHPDQPDEPGDDAQAWEAAFHQRDDDVVQRIEADAPLLFEPGGGVAYSGPAYAVLSHVLAVALDGSPWSDLDDLLNDELMTPLGLDRPSWSIGYDDDVFEVDGLDVHATWGGAAFTLRTTARLGVLLLQEGRWRDRQLLSPEVVRDAISYARTGPVPTPIATGRMPAPAIGWWSNQFNALPALPPDAFLAAGAGHRVLVVVPSLDLVIVRYGERLGEDHWDGDYWQVMNDVFLAPVIEALRGADAERTVGGF